MKMNFTTILLILILAIPPTLQGQVRTITGTVTDPDGMPLPGASILVKGTTQGTETDFDGNYTIDTENGATLVYSYVGMNTVEKLIDSSTPATINIAFSIASESLDEVVVIGYGTSTKRKVTDNIASISSDQISEVPTPSVQSSLAGKAAGVQITQVNGKAESGIKMRVRGVSTISSSQEPLYVIDGVPMINSDENINDSPVNPLVGINPEDIESIEILKDASSAAIYGARGTNGVVLISTKRGKAGKTRVSINSSVGNSTPTNYREFLNTRQYVELFTEAALNSGYDESVVFGQFNIYANQESDWRNAEVDTDWQKLALNDGSVQDFSINVAGGSESTTFFLSTGYNKTDAIIRGNNLERYTFRANLDHTLSEKFKVGFGSSISKTKINRLANDNAFASPMQAIAQIPFTRAYEEDNPKVPNAETLYYNFLFQEYNADHQSNLWRILANIYAQYNITPELNFRTEVGYDFNNQVEERFYGRLTESASVNGSADANAVQNEKYVLNNYFTLNKNFGDDIAFEAILGMSFEEDRRRTQYVAGQDFPSDELQTVASASEITSGSSTRTAFNFLSYFSRASATLFNKILLKASIRYDGSSRFGKDERYGWFPAFSAGYILSEEGFLAESDLISLLKLRASWGVTGNADIGNFASRSLFGGISYNNRSGLAPTQIGDKSLKWETTTQYDLGFDFGFLRNKITGEFDYYSKTTDDLLLNQPLPATSGFQNITRNVGKIRNTGIEFVLRTKNFTTDNFTWTTSFNIAKNKNEVLELPGGDIISGVNIVREGESLANFYMVEFAGADPDNGDALFVRNTPLPNGGTDKSTTNNFNEASRVIVASPYPDWIGGFSSNMSFYGFDFSFTFQGQWGADIYNNGGTYQSSSADYFDNQTADQLDRWQQPGDITNVPQARLLGGNGTQTSTRYLQNADFIRLRNITLGYTVPSDFTKKFYVERLRVYVTGLNLLTFTNYDGWDPESTSDFNANNNIAVGVDFYSAPPAKTFSIGVNIDF